MKEAQLVPSSTHAQEKQLFESSAHMQEVQLISSHQHAQGLLVLSPRHAQEKQLSEASAYMQEVQLLSSHQHAEGLQLVLSPRHAQEKQLSEALSYMQEVQLFSSNQHAEGLQLVLSSRHAQEKQLSEALSYMQELQLISSHQHAQGLQLVLSPRHAQEKQLSDASAYMQELQLISSHQHAQGLQLILSPRHEQEKKLFESLAYMQEQLIPTAQHAQGIHHFQSPRHVQEKQLFQSSEYMQEVQLIRSPQHAQGLPLVQAPRHAQDKLLFQSSVHMQEVELIPSPQHAQGTQLVDSPAHMEETQPVQTLAQVQKTQHLHSPTRVKEIAEYLMANELWRVPDSVLYEEPTVETQCDLETCLGQTNDATEEAEENQEINTFNVENSVEEKLRKRGGRRHKGHFMRRPMALSKVIEELKDDDLRENALRCLSGHLVERREQDPDFYRQAGFYIFHSSSTLVILIQEILFVYEKFNTNELNIRRSKRMANVLCLLQCVATNDETRLLLVKARIPNYLIPFIISEYTEEAHENLRALSLSVICILCQALQTEVIQWALQSNIIEICFHALDVGSELSKVLAMTVLDSILRVDEGLSAICEPSCELLPRFIKLCDDLVSILAYIRGFSPRLLFLVVRSFVLLCQNCRALELLKEQLPTQLQDTTFLDVKMEYPLFAYLRHLLLLCTGKATDYLPSVGPSPATPTSSSSASKNREDKNSPGSGQTRNESVRAYVTPMRPIDLDKQDWSSSARLMLQT